MARKSLDQQLEDLKRKEENVRKQRQQTELQLRKREERDRARRYMQLGSALDSWGVITADVAERILSELASTPTGRESLRRAGANPTPKWPESVTETEVSASA